jgi:hypothetical protein
VGVTVAVAEEVGVLVGVALAVGDWVLVGVELAVGESVLDGVGVIAVVLVSAGTRLGDGVWGAVGASAMCVACNSSSAET